MREYRENERLREEQAQNLPVRYVAPQRIYAVAYERYKSAMTIKVLAILFCYALCLLSCLVDSDIVRAVLGVLSCIGIFIQALTLPTGIVRDKQGNCLNLYSGEITLKK